MLEVDSAGRQACHMPVVEEESDDIPETRAGNADEKRQAQEQITTRVNGQRKRGCKDRRFGVIPPQPSGDSNHNAVLNKVSYKLRLVFGSVFKITARLGAEAITSS